MRNRALRHRDEDTAYRQLRARLLPGLCEAGTRLVRLADYGGCEWVGRELHHLRKRSAGGALAEPDNVVVCCHTCNMWIEDHPDVAEAAGLVVRDGHLDWDRLGARAWRENR